MRRIRKEDEVIVISGRDKGKRGRVMRMIDDQRVIVSGINMVKRHTKPQPQKNQPGGIIEKEAAIHISNVSLFNSEAQRGDRVSFRVNDKNDKERIFRSSEKAVD